MKSIYTVIMALVIPFLMLSKSQVASAADEDECATYICLPAGFGPSECSDSYDAMVDRLEDGDSPLPSWGACFSDSDSDSVIPIQTEYGNATIVDSEFAKDQTCRRRANNEWEPVGCNGRNYWYIEVYDEKGTPYPLMNSDDNGATVGNTRYVPK
ncbi:MAG: hypothetical protein HLX50_18195 [Alteromonadaceae bacterium]|nr:hypothetical protein [Alteromonadaceae bacterium]